MMLNKQKNKKWVTKATEIKHLENTNVWSKCRGSLFNDVSGWAEVAHLLISKPSSLKVGHPFPMETLTVLCIFGGCKTK